jgi:heme-degrading monooxygenase HmoA
MFQQRVVPEMSKSAGFAGAILSIDRASGKAISATFWDSEEAMRASEQDSDERRAQVAQAIGAKVLDVDRFEIVLPPSRPPAANVFVRMTDLPGSPDKIEDTIRLVREEATPLLQQQKGFRAVVMGANRQTGRMFVNTIWETAADREASEAAVQSSRTRGAQVAGAQQASVELYEVVYADVKMPAQTRAGA